MDDIPRPFLTAPATWDGVVQLAREYYPDVVDELERHLPEICSTPYPRFEEMAGFKLIESRKACGVPPAESIATGQPPHYNYEYFSSLPKPRTVWQMRAFLYCEFHLLENFSGDGYTVDSDGHRNCKEYLCPNILLSSLETSEIAVMPLNITIPD